MSTRVQPFEREFAPQDVAVFNTVAADLVGHRCVRVDRLYGGAFSLHFGEMQPGITTQRRERGQWVVTAWGCDARLTSGAEVYDDRSGSRERLIELLSRLVGLEVLSISVESEQVTLSLAFGSGHELDLIPDPTFDGDAWTIALPARQTVAANSARVWSIEDDRPVE